MTNRARIKSGLGYLPTAINQTGGKLKTSCCGKEQKKKNNSALLQWRRNAELIKVIYHITHRTCLSFIQQGSSVMCVSDPCEEEA